MLGLSAVRKQSQQNPLESLVILPQEYKLACRTIVSFPVARIRAACHTNMTILFHMYGLHFKMNVGFLLRGCGIAFALIRTSCHKDAGFLLPSVDFLAGRVSTTSVMRSWCRNTGSISHACGLPIRVERSKLAGVI